MDCCLPFLGSLPAAISSPSYIFDESELLRKMAEIRSHLSSCTSLCFAMKANPFLIGLLEPYSDYFEVCSPGEYEICRQKGIPPEKIIVSGVNKTEASMSRIFSQCGDRCVYTIESPLHFDILEKLARSSGTQLHVLIRLSSGNQFGVDRNTFGDILQGIQQSSSLHFDGIHYFSGTQKKEKRIAKELGMLQTFGEELKQKFHLPSLMLEYGPGLSVVYFEGDKVSPPEEQLDSLNENLKTLTAFDRIGIEMGRFIAASCGHFLTRVADMKCTDGETYVILDSGIHQLHYFGQMMGMKIPAIRQIPDRSGEESYTLCGSLCTVNDVMVRNVRLHTLAPGDFLIFGNCGAYSMTEGSALFLSRELPAVYALKQNGDLNCLRALSETFPFNTAII